MNGVRAYTFYRLRRFSPQRNATLFLGRTFHVSLHFDDPLRMAFAVCLNEQRRNTWNNERHVTSQLRGQNPIRYIQTLSL
jgi:hypothetical protein